MDDVITNLQERRIAMDRQEKEANSPLQTNLKKSS
jgi:hypothetical protein